MASLTVLAFSFLIEGRLGKTTQCVPDIVLRALHQRSHSACNKNPIHFAEEETEARKCQVTQRKQVGEAGQNVGT